MIQLLSPHTYYDACSDQYIDTPVAMPSLPRGFTKDDLNVITGMLADPNKVHRGVTTTPAEEAPSDPPRGLKFDQGKLRYDLIPPIATRAMAEVLTFGAAKYAPNSWQTVPDAESRYTAALMRHFEAYRSGEEHDQETNLSHLSHAITNIAFLLHLQNERLNGG